MRKLRLLAAAVVSSAALMTTGATAGPKDNSLNISWDWVLPSYDLYFNQSVAAGQMVGRLIWDHLILRDLSGGGDYEPILATEWRWIDPLTLEFDLRQGVKFHDGSEFTADDVVYMVKFVSNPENKVNIQNMVSWMEDAEKIGPYQVRITLKKPFPPALQYVSSTLAIYPSKYYADVGPKGMSDNPVGSGPYKVTEAKAGETITLVKNENYFEGGAKGQPHIDKIVQRTIPDTQTRVAELLSGRIDWTYGIPPDMVDTLNQQPNVKVVEAETMRIGYVTLDAAGRSSKELADVRVRKAISHAINRQAISEHLFPGTRLISANCHPIQFGCPADLPVYDYDPAKAKALLAEAGYPNGFEVDFYAYRDRRISEALIGDLRNVGIKVNLQYMSFPSMYEKKLNWETPIVHATTGSWSIADVLVPLSVTFQGGKADMANDAVLTGWIDEAANLIDQERRKELYEMAYRRIVEEAYIVPLTTDVKTYAMHKDLDFQPGVDEVGLFYRTKWNTN